MRSEYDQLARDHVLGLPDQQQKLLNIALGGGGEATLIQFASSCAARIMFEDPTTVREALAGPDAAEWQDAIDEEVNSLIKFQVFEVVTKETALKAGRLMKCKWILKTKRLKSGEIERRKARLVCLVIRKSPAAISSRMRRMLQSWVTQVCVFSCQLQQPMIWLSQTSISKMHFAKTQSKMITCT